MIDQFTAGRPIALVQLEESLLGSLHLDSEAGCFLRSRLLGLADVGGTQARLNVGANWYIARQALKLTAMAVVPLWGNPAGPAAEVLPPQGLGGGAEPNNNVSLLVQLQAEF